MSAEPKKQERDFTPEVGTLLPEVDAIAGVSNFCKKREDTNLVL